ncbi:Protein of unknown function [Pseudovibrio denitrificans]|uniref:Uncharacterized protein n=3 Tax=Stappiaceae TaxID=2821832 RepID=A0A1I7DA99_9HYPH|nr:MbcA/ParS/Xre antitoxin family protein [Pseudovibrio brasiliensis]QUS58358.1 DUF2384 domain-containing protein [Pseudovibrio brasiliensis]SFU08557.1 Protein of unknown function [Pseudovibrio denitrificans]
MPSLRKIEQPLAPGGPKFTEEEVHAMQRAVINLFDRWQLTDEQATLLLGDIAKRTYQRWKTKHYGRVSVDLAARLSNLLGIHKALRLLFSDPNRGYGWVKRPNTDFGGKTALEIMLGGQLTDLMRVRRYLDAQRGNW